MGMPKLRHGWLIPAVLALLITQDSPAAQTKPSEADRLGLTYEVYSGGFHVLTVDLDLSFARQRYDVTTRLQTAGFLSWLVSWSQISESAGLVDGTGLAPERYRSEGEFRGRRRAIEIDYDAGQVSAVKVEPPSRGDEDRDEVTEAQRREAVDPLAAILGAIHRLSAGQPCEGRLRVFDGRRRYDLVLTDRGTRPLRESRIAAFAGDALQCDFVFEQIAGHIRRPTDPEVAQRRLQSGRVYSARSGGPLMTPVRIELDSEWGMTVAHLREMRNGASGAAR
jgi:Protein of unknown function (DUF3108)